MADRVHAGEHAGDGRLVPDVLTGPQVERPYVMAALAQRLDDVRSDEPGGTSHEYAHTRTLTRARRHRDDGGGPYAVRKKSQASGGRLTVSSIARTVGQGHRHMHARQRRTGWTGRW